MGRVVIIVPIGNLEGAKSRLGEVLDAEERGELVRSLVRRTLDAARQADGVAEVVVISPDDDVRALALAAGARPIHQRSSGLNAAVVEARAEALTGGADAVAIVPVDLPLVSAEALEGLLAPLADPARPMVVIVPDRRGRGTNALVLAPPSAIEPTFGGDSRKAHVSLARAAGARLVELDGPLTFDLDTPDDLLLAEELLHTPADGR